MPGAVFLSYASQDAEAAQKICAALRAAGLEVWFDRSELRGGDAWDGKIRKQIKECALFVPVISANTNARPEGYFRLEWKLAVDRSHLLADDHPFLFPVVIDDTADATARVPEKFREVQWSRLNVRDTPETLARRLAQLLAGEAMEPGRPRPGERGEGAASPKKSSRGWLGYAWAVAGMGIGLVYALRPLWVSRREPAPAAAPARPEAERLLAQARARRIETRDELVVAIDLAKRATELAPDSARAWGVRAYLEGQYVQRGWDISEQRRQDTQAFANRALALDPNTTDAMFALAVVLQQQGAFAQIEALMRRAMAIDPTVAALRLALGVALSGQGREAEALAVREETLRLFPSDPLAHYDLALSYERAPTPDFDAALRKFDDSLALRPFTSTVLHKASLLAGWKGDLPAARQLLDRMAPMERTGDRAVGIAMTIGLLEHRPERTIEAGELTARSYLEDEYVRGPKAWLLAHAYAMANKQGLAQAQWREAERLLRERLRMGPGNGVDDAGLAVTLAWLGASDESARLIAPLESAARESSRAVRPLYLAYYYAGRGDAAKTAAYLRPLLDRSELLTRRTLPLDPWWDKVRAQSEFSALLAESASPPKL